MDIFVENKGMEIAINRSSVVDDVAMHVSIATRGLVDGDGNSLYDKVAIQERDKGLIGVYASSALGELKRVMADFVSGCTDSSITLAEGRRFNSAAVSDLGGFIHDYMVFYSCAEWMKIKFPEYAPAFAGRAKAIIDSIFEKLRKKDEPTKKLY